MATFTIVANTNTDALVGKGGADTYNVNGFKLTIDQDSRCGLNNDSSSTMGTVTPSATLGGDVSIDGRAVRLIPYNTGTGNVPTSNTVISQGGASGLLIGVYANLTSAPTAAGAAMPASGYIKIKQWNSVAYAAGALTGIGATATGPDVVGWIEVVGTESTNWTFTRLNNGSTPLIQGDWYQLGVTDGNRATTYQIPSNGVNQYHGGVWVETVAGSGAYEFYPATVDTFVSTNISTSALKGKWCSISTAGVVRFGHDGTNSSGGYCPPTGCKVRMPNVFMTAATAAAKTQNAWNATLSTRPRFLTSGAGRFDVRNASFNWGLASISNTQYLNMLNCAISDNLSILNPANASSLTQVGIGSNQIYTATRLLLNNALVGMTFIDVTVGFSSQGASGNVYCIAPTDCSDITFIRTKAMFSGQKGSASQFSFIFSRTPRVTLTDCTAGQGFSGSSSDNFTITNLTYFDSNGGQNLTTNAQYMYTLATLCNNWTTNGVNIANGDQPRNGLFWISATCNNFVMKNVGSYNSPIGTGQYGEDGAAWSRVTTTVTVTTASPHGHTTGDVIQVYRSDVVAAIALGVYTITVTGANTFTFTGVNSGATSGVLSYYFGQMARGFLASSCDTVKVQNVHVRGIRTALYGVDNTVFNLYIENSSFDPLYPGGIVASANNMRSFGATGTPASQSANSATYGTLIRSGYVSESSASVPNGVGVSWSRTTTVCTVTKTNHGLVSGARIMVMDATNQAMLGGNPVVSNITVINKDTFTIPVTNTGTTTGTLDYNTADGAVFIDMNEDNAVTDSQFTVLAGSPAFTGAGGLTMFNVNDEVYWESTDRFITDFDKAEVMLPALTGGNLQTNFELKYDLDTGSGFSGTYKNLSYPRSGAGGSASSTNVTMTDTTGVAVGDYVFGQGIANGAKVQSITNSTTIVVTIANTGAVSGTLQFNQLPNFTSIVSTGFKIRVKIKCIATNAVALSFLRLFFRSTNTTRANLYPQVLTAATYKFTGLASGTVVALYNSSNVELQRTTVGGSGIFTYSYTHNGTDSTGNYALIWHTDYYVQKYTAITLSATSQSVAVLQIADLAYIASSPSISTFDYTNKVHVMNPSVSSGAQVDISLRQLYSNWKDDIVLSNNFIYALAYEVQGGQPTFGTQKISLFFFQKNGWKLRPREINHTATLTTGVLVAESGAPVIPTVGSFNVMVDYQKPEHVITLNSDDPVTPTDVANAVLDASQAAHVTAGTIGKSIKDASKAKLLL